MGVPAITCDPGSEDALNDVQVSVLPEDINKLESSDGKKTRKGNVVQRNYTLNDTGALKKKLKWETSRKVDFALGKEAKNGCNISLLMKSSFFEMVKEFFIADLEEVGDIVLVENAEAAKAGTEHSGDAYVEYSMEITFKVEEKEHAVKMIAYTTSCSMMIQNITEKLMNQKVT